MKHVRVCGHSFLLDLLQDGGMVLDCGANKGEFSTWLLKHSPGIRIYAFEPDPRLFEALPDLPGLRKVNKAITGTGGAMEICLWLGEERCSSVYYKEDESQQFVKVPSITLDDFCRVERIGWIDLVKLDIEGAEIDLLGNISPQLLTLA